MSWCHYSSSSPQTLLPHLSHLPSLPLIGEDHVESEANEEAVTQSRNCEQILQGCRGSVYLSNVQD